MESFLAPILLACCGCDSFGIWNFIKIDEWAAN